MDDLHFKPKQTIQPVAQGGSSRVINLAVIGLGVASLAITAVPARAFQTTVDFSQTPTVSSQTSRTFNGGFGVEAIFSKSPDQSIEFGQDD